MKKRFSILFVAITSFAFAQYGYRDSNMIGITLGINQFSLNTSDFEAKAANGWNAGLSVRGNFYNDWDAIYAIQFSEYNYKVATLNQFSKETDVNYKIPAVSLSFLFSYKFIENHLSVEMGPLMQINGMADIDSEDENLIVKGNPGYLAKDLTDINMFSFYPVVGLTAGIRNVRLNVTYQYGLNNMLGNLEGDFKGNASVVNGNIIFYL